MKGGGEENVKECLASFRPTMYNYNSDWLRQLRLSFVTSLTLLHVQTANRTNIDLSLCGEKKCYVKSLFLLVVVGEN